MGDEVIRFMRASKRGRVRPLTERLALPRTRLGLILVGLAVIFFGVNFGQRVAADYQINQQVQQLQQQIDAVNASNATLEEQIGYYQTPGYVISRARGLLYQHKGDIVFRFEDDPNALDAAPPAAGAPSSRPAPPPASPWWQRLLRLFGQ
jgi:cell division protein FtsB